MKLQTSLPLLSLLLFIFACEQMPSNKTTQSQLSQQYNSELQPFYHGVASGDPLSDRVIIWTRLTPEQTSSTDNPVKWEVATDGAMTSIVAEGIVEADPNRDYTIKLDVTGLQPDTYYYYHFISKGRKSATGRTKTAPARNADSARVAFITCTNYEAGFYNALALLARQADLDAVVHLGDYIYEYAAKGYGDPSLGRFHLPDKELITLTDYRTRYAQYRLDSDFQAVHQQHPFVVIWDDHEIANNAFVAGAQNHQEEDGDYIQRREAARQAYYEWLPIRENVGGQLYRKIHLGRLAEILLLDERLAGRTAPVENLNSEEYLDENRTMLGHQQYQWLTKSLSSSEARWKIVGSQVTFSDFDRRKEGQTEQALNMDAWDGFPAEKRELIRYIREHQIDNLLIVSGDTHCSWAFEVPTSIAAYKADPATNAIATELAVPSVTSSNYDEHQPRNTAAAVVNTYRKNNPHLKYGNICDHGYLLLEIDTSRIRASWHYVETVKKRSLAEQVGGVVRIDDGVSGVVEE